MVSSGKCALTWLATLLFVVPVAAEEDIQRKTYTSKEELLRDYEPAAKRLIEAYSKIILEAECTNRKSATPVPERETYRYFANGPRLRLDIDTPDSKVELKKHLVIGDQLAFSANQLAGKELRLADVSRREDVQMRIGVHGPLVLGAINFFERSILDWLRQDSLVHFRSAEWVKEGEDWLLKVWLAIGENQEQAERVDWLLFDPARHWVCRGFSMGYTYQGASYPDSKAIFGVFHYRGEVNGVPALSKAELFSQNKEKLFWKQEFQVTRIEAASVPATEFTLTALGLPEVEVAVSRVRYYVIGLLIVGTAAVALCLWLQRRMRRFNAG